MSQLHRLARLLIIFGLLSMLVIPQAARATLPIENNRQEDQSPGSTLGARPNPVIDADLAAQVEQGPAQAIIYLREQADLSPAYSISDKLGRRQFVYNALKAAADRSGGDLFQWLQALGTRPTQLWIVNAILASLDASQLAAVASRPEVAKVSANQTRSAIISGEEGSAIGPATLEWNIEKIRADEAWNDLGVTGEGAVIGDIDTGVAYLHPALVNQYRGNLGGGTFDHNYNWYDITFESLFPVDPNGHGTMGVGIAVGDDGGTNQIGVAPGAKWIAFRACTAGGSCSEAALLYAGQWMMAPTDLNGNNPDPGKAPDIVLSGWGGGTCDAWYDSVLMAWQAANILPVFSPGGGGPACGSVASPADSPYAFAAGATDTNDVIASFSGRGPSCWNEIKPEVVAPGVDIRSSFPPNGYTVWSGSAESAAHLAGLAALVVSANSDLSTGEIETIIEDSANCIYDGSCGGEECPGANNVYGNGRIDAYEAVSLAMGQQQAKWTFMVYMAADNNLEGAGVDDFLEMATAGSDENLNIVVQYDRTPGYDNRYGDWTSTKRFLVGPGMTPTAENALEDIGEANMGDPQTVIDFVTWARAEYPAENYALVFWNHGGGWLEDFSRPKAGGPEPEDFCWDDTNGGDAITSAELYSLLDTITIGGTDPIEQIGFDACVMAMWEVDNQIKPFGSVTSISSEANEPYDGWPYHTILGDLKANPTWTPDELGSCIVDRYFEYYGNDQTQSAKSLADLYTALNEAVDDFALALIEYEPTYHSQYDTARNATLDFGVGIDLSNFASKIKQYVPEPEVMAAADGVIAAVDAAVINEKHGGSWPGATGIDFYFPSSLGNWSAYQAMWSSQNTHWDEFVQYHITGELPCGFVSIDQVTYTIEGLNVAFVSSVTGEPPIDFLWDFGDGETSTDPNPTHTFPDYGSYTVSLQVSNCSGSGSDTWTKVIQLIPGCSNPVALYDVSYTVDDLAVMFDSTVSGEEPISYLWDFGDGQTSTEADPIHFYADYGDYDVNLQVSNCGGLATDRWEETVAVHDIPCLLLVDDDQDAPDVQAAYTAALDALGIEYGVWDVAVDGDPSAEDLAVYKMVAWYTGAPWSNTFTPVNESAVGSYLDAGGNFFLTSQDYLYEFNLTPFGENYLHIGSFTNDLGQTTVTGLNIFGSLGPYNLTYPYNNYSDEVNPAGDAWEAFIGDQGSAAITYESDTFKTAFFGYPFETLPAGGRTEVMERLVDFFGGCQNGYLTGRVTDAVSDDPLQGALVYAGEHLRMTGPDGTYTFELTPGAYDMSAEADCYATQYAQDIVVTAGMTTTQGFALQPLPPVIEVNPTQVTLEVEYGQQGETSFDILNIGCIPLEFEISEAIPADWLTVEPVTGTLPGGEDMPVLVLVDAAQLGIGVYTNTLFIESNAGGVAVEVTVIVQAPDIEVEPLVFTATVPYEGTATQPITISNSGNLNLDYEAFSSEPYLTVTPTIGVVLPGESEVVAAEIDTTGLFPGAYQTKITINSNDLDEPAVEVVANIIVEAPPEQEIAVLPASLDVTLYPDASTAESLTVYNLGTLTLTYEIGEAIPWLALAPTTGGELQQGEAAIYTATLSSVGLDVGVYTGTIDVLSNDPDEGELLIPVTLNVVLPTPDIDVDPMQFSVDLVPTQPWNEFLTVSNLGDADLVFTVTENAVWLSVIPVGGVISPDGSDQLIVSIDTTGLVTGTYTATIAISSNDPDEPVVEVPVTLVLNPTPNEPMLFVDPRQIGATLLPGESTVGMMTIYNLGSVTLTYEISNSISWLTVAPTSSLISPVDHGQLLVNFNATSLVPGVYTGMFTILSDGGNVDVEVMLQVIEPTIYVITLPVILKATEP